MTIKAKRFLARVFPEQQDFFLRQQTIRKLTPRPIPLPEALVRVISGQMLSSKAAHTIYARLTTASEREGLAGSWLLNESTLRTCGLSSSKAKAVLQLQETIGSDASALDSWKDMDYEALEREICSYKGLGRWSAGIIALFYLGFEDVFPEGDSSLNKALEILSLSGSAFGPACNLNIDLARPLRSYLALYLWQGLDAGFLESASC